MTTPEYDPFSYELDQDPYPTYRWMRDVAPVYHNERLDFWAFTRFADNLEAFIDTARYSSTLGTSLEFMDTPQAGHGPDDLDGPARAQRATAGSSRRRSRRARIAELEPRIRASRAGTSTRSSAASASTW